MKRFQPTRAYHWPLSVTLGALRMLNTYESTGVFEGRESRLEDLIIEHLAVQSELRKLNAAEEVLCRMVAEGYTQKEVATELGCSKTAVGRKMRKIGWGLLGVPEGSQSPFYGLRRANG